jgi:NTE family protein
MTPPRTPPNSRTPRIGLALGGGAARGWAHIGVLRGLQAAGIQPDLVCGTSVGALVGAAYAAGELDRFERWASSLAIRDVMSFMDIHLSGGMLKGEKLMEFFRHTFGDRPIEELELPFGAVATALKSGAEVWLRNGSTIAAVRASIALPALFTPVLHEGVVVVDGGLVNPVPVSLARAMGADVIIAVDLASDILGRHLREAAQSARHAALRGEVAEDAAGQENEETVTSQVGNWMKKLQDNLGALIPDRDDKNGDSAPEMPSMLDVVASSLNIMQVRLTRSRMAGDPPDVTIAPRLAHLGLMDFHRAAEAIEEGRRAVELALPALRSIGLADMTKN